MGECQIFRCDPDFPDEEGETGLVVRATDGNSQLQISEYRGQVPDGEALVNVIEVS